jgi:chemotaxis protein MotA
VKLDIMLILGYVGMLSIMFIGLTLSHGTPQEIWSGEGFIMAFGGAVVGTLAGLSTQELRDSLGCIKVAFMVKQYDYEKLITDFVNYAGISRKDGLLGLEKVINGITDPFLNRAIQMAIDGVEPDLVEERLAVELSTMEERHIRGRATFDTMATFSPAFGMIGTIMGLVLVLKSLDDPSKIGPKMAVALLSTFYGVLACYSVFTPISKKLERKHRHENLYKMMIVKGIVWLQTGDSPRSIEAKLRAFLREKRG